MSRKTHDAISSLNRGRTDWKIKVKVIRNWRGSTSTGEIFKAFNVILIDQQASKIHAFIPAKCANQHELSLREGKICLIKNFTVQKYKEDDKFRAVHDENQLIFSAETKVKELEDKVNTFPTDAFDFFDHSELKELADRTPYLIDVVGIIENREEVTLRELMTRQGRNQFQTKFKITDGSSCLSVTLWDVMAQTFHKQLIIQEEEPVIVILSCCRCGSWNKELDLSNVGATNFYLNYNHHSVKQIRKMIATPEFSQRVLGKQKRKITELHNIADIKKLGKEYIQSCVMVHANIRYVDEVEPWLLLICTQCKKKVVQVQESFTCLNCKRRIPHVEKRFKINVVVSDKTGPMEVELNDREVRILTGKRAEEVFKEHKNLNKYPPLLKDLLNMDVTAKLRITEGNVLQADPVYLATNICTGFYIDEETTTEATESLQQSTLQPSTSTYHLDGMSELNFN